MAKFIDWVRKADRDFVFFLLASVFLGIGQSVDGSTLNNFLREKFHFLIEQRSALEIPRELPGFLVFLVIGFLYAFGDLRIAVCANLMAAVGMFLLGVIPKSFPLMVLCIFVYSMGQHVYMPLSNSIAMSFASGEKLGRKLGQVSAANTAALVGASGILWLLFRFFSISYTVSFTIGALAFILAAISLAFINTGRVAPIKSRFVFRKQYGLFYWLSVLYGMRKQIFITFGPWVLVDVFDQRVTTMTILFFVISISGIFVKPFVGFLIDRAGERFVFGAEAVILVVVCLGYAYAEDLFAPWLAVLVVSACYVMDQTLNAVGMARATYLKKIAVDESDVSPALSTGISIDHIMSMFIPTAGGLLWSMSGNRGYKYVFICGALIAVVNFISTRFIKTDRSGQESDYESKAAAGG